MSIRRTAVPLGIGLLLGGLLTVGAQQPLTERYPSLRARGAAMVRDRLPSDLRALAPAVEAAYQLGWQHAAAADGCARGGRSDSECLAMARRLGVVD